MIAVALQSIDRQTGRQPDMTRLVLLQHERSMFVYCLPQKPQWRRDAEGRPAPTQHISICNMQLAWIICQSKSYTRTHTHTHTHTRTHSYLAVAGEGRGKREQTWPERPLTCKQLLHLHQIKSLPRKNTTLFLVHTRTNTVAACCQRVCRRLRTS